ncbi:immunity protein Imm33 domain-containing protein [Blastopirellula retiformator]|uniref:Imm33-like domain-containing protein n=1 Tax=Blastopirellula retiformator TaxID=2527970 RepID=A0A5C5VB02_9BACT|nr:hypothetical protein [Blastopirellula retiformator]TWT34795.1 hypothetical protein Enr8_22090 [Blastopirellula retiformator]TWT34799.1 hypothetical protein Enr8_22130 [Blastopirellula retiformator]
MTPSETERQWAVCEQFSATPMPCPLNLKVGIAQNVREGVEPLNGLRVKPIGDTTGWFIWAGEWSDDPSYFVPLHVEHLVSWCPQVIPYLQLPIGWRFLLAPSFEDVWFDRELAKQEESDETETES